MKHLAGLYRLRPAASLLSALAIAVVIVGESMSAESAVGRSRAVRPARRRPRRSRQAGRRQGRARCRAAGYRDRDQVLQDRSRLVAPRAVPAWPRLRRQPAVAGGDRRLAQGGRQGLDLGDGRTRRALWHRRRRRQGRGAGAKTVRARRRSRQSARRQQSRRAWRRRRCAGRSGAGAASCWRRPPRPMRRRSISSG